MPMEKTWRIKTVDGGEDLYVESDFEMENAEGMLIFKTRGAQSTITYPVTGIVRFSETVADSATATLAGIR